MLNITQQISIPLSELDFAFITSSGPGGQNVNKVATAVQLRFDVAHSPSLPEAVRTRFMALYKNQITTSGEFIIKANRHRTQERNKQDAIQRLCDMLRLAAKPIKKRKKTKPTRASRERRLSNKKLQGQKKSLRRGQDF